MSVLKKNQPNKLALFSALTAALVMTSGCQSLKTANATNQPIGTVQGQKPKQKKYPEECMQSPCGG